MLWVVYLLAVIVILILALSCFLKWTKYIPLAVSGIFGLAAAMASFAIIPIFLITLFMQKHLVRGMTLGGVKG